MLLVDKHNWNLELSFCYVMYIFHKDITEILNEI